MENNNNAESTDEDLESAILYVYSSCDVENNNRVSVSRLLDFITNSTCTFKFPELRKRLDLDGNNLSISFETFSRIVTEWVCGQRLSLTNGLSKEQYDGGDETFPGITQCYDGRERVKELEHKNKQLVGELDYVKEQLAGVEEQHDSLLDENKKLSQKLLKIEKLNNELRSTKRNDSEFIEAVDQHEKDIHKLKKTLAVSEKIINSLKGDLKAIEDEKKKLQDKLNLQKKYGDAKIKLIKELEMELQDKEKKILSFLDINSKLQTELSEQQQHVVHYTECDRILKEQIKHLESVIQDHELRFSLLKTTIISSPKPETPGRNVLTQILNFNSPKLLKSLANPVSPNLDSPINFDCFRFSPDQNRLNDSDLICNNESGMSVTISCDNSLCDEILLADQEFHKHECQKIIKQQKSQLEELQDAVKTYKEAEEKLKGEIEKLSATITDLESSAEKLRHENEDLLRSLSEEIKTRDVLHEEVVLLRECKNNKRLGNFSKMEIKLEKRDSEIEMLRNMLGAEKKISEKLKEEMLALADENALVMEEKRLAEEQLQRARDKTLRELDENSRTGMSVELDQLASQIQDGDQLNFDRHSELYFLVMKAVKNDEKTIDLRYKQQHTYYVAHQAKLWEEFTKLEFMLRNLQLRLVHDPIAACLQQLKILKEVSQDNQEVATTHGTLRREHSVLKYIQLLVTFTTQMREKAAYNEISSKKTMSPKRKVCSCCSVLFGLVLFLLGLEIMLYFNGVYFSFFNINPYVNKPPPI